MAYQVKINEFEGPLDLLLHLIKEADIDIYLIKLEEITKQYLDYIKEMEKLNLSIASEYLVLAAELIEIKAKSLLPKKESNDNEEAEEDPREKLINRLIEYQAYKEITNNFKELKEERDNIFTKIPSSLKEYSLNIKRSSNVSGNDLVEALVKFLNQTEEDRPLQTKIINEEWSLKERSNFIKEILKDKKSVSFFNLFAKQSKSLIVVTFLSILDLANKGEIIIRQNNSFDIIYLELKGSV
ncbi:MAG: segregation and condensation protein A [Bacilli bacterium]